LLLASCPLVKATAVPGRSAAKSREKSARFQPASRGIGQFDRRPTINSHSLDSIVLVHLKSLPP
jgi:hypothetical protein